MRLVVIVIITKNLSLFLVVGLETICLLLIISIPTSKLACRVQGRCAGTRWNLVWPALYFSAYTIYLSNICYTIRSEHCFSTRSLVGMSWVYHQPLAGCQVLFARYFYKLDYFSLVLLGRLIATLPGLELLALWLICSFQGSSRCSLPCVP